MWGKSFISAFSFFGFIEEFLEFWRAVVDISSLLGLHEVSGVDGIHCVGINRDEEAGNGEGNQAHDDKEEGPVLDRVSVAGHILDNKIDDEDGQESNTQPNQEGKELNNIGITVWTMATIELVAMELILTVKARPAAVQ